MARPLKPSTPFAERLIEARGEMTREAAAAALGCLKDTLGGYERGRNFPDQATLAKIGEVYGVSLDWLITGRGQKCPAEAVQAPASAPATVDEELMAHVAEGIAGVYREENARIYPVPLVRAAARMYDDLVAAYDSPEERQVGLKGMLQQLRRELRSPGAAGANSKQVS
jgi:transcriptional regulator with XRE-family HTH domain